MRTPRCAIVAAILSAAFVVGCGGGEETKPVNVQPNDTSRFDKMKDQMTKNLKSDKSGKPIPGQ